MLSVRCWHTDVIAALRYGAFTAGINRRSFEPQVMYLSPDNMKALHLPTLITAIITAGINRRSFEPQVMHLSSGNMKALHLPTLITTIITAGINRRSFEPQVMHLSPGNMKALHWRTLIIPDTWINALRQAPSSRQFDNIIYCSYFLH